MIISAVPFYKNADKPVTEEIAGLAHEEANTVKSKAKAITADADETDSAPATSTRRRGRPRKIKPEADPEEVPGDETYAPVETATIAAGDIVPPEELDWEASAVAWALSAVGGLGCGSAGVFGGECISR